LWRPVLAQMWRQSELSDGTYSFHDLVEVHRVLNVKDENQRRANKAAQPKT
jgi:hypothetical protein